MAGASLVLGIDVGTGGSKAILVDAGGTVVANVTTEYPLFTPRPQWSEQDPHAWWDATAASCRAALAEAKAEGGDVAAVGLTGQMHGLVLLDAAGKALRPAILWNDQRTGAQCAAIHERVGLETVCRITGKPALTGFTAPKILWVREREPEVYAAAATMLLPKDYVRYRMTGTLGTDVADASGTTLFDVARRQWSSEMIEGLDVPAEWLPPVAESPVVTAEVSAGVAAETGLRPGTPVVAGAGDQAAEAVGCGIVDNDAVSVTIGTSGVVFAATDAPRLDPDGRIHAYCHAVPGMWHLMGVMLSAGGSFRWYRDTLGGGADYDTLIAHAKAIPPGAEGLSFLPYLTGERTPHPDPAARGAFVGLTLRHGLAHCTRAVMEGVTFGLMDALELTRGLGVQIDVVRASGGGTRSETWRQMMADVFDARVETVNVAQGAAYGAAVLAGVGAGWGDDVASTARRLVRATPAAEPGPDRSRYRAHYETYRGLYPALAPTFERITNVVAGEEER
jgi:xylulokinase